jgi:hypothetical protein
MPTGLTADIADGISFKQFALTCARQFGALYFMRDLPMDAPIPDQLPVDSYYPARVEEAEDALAELLALTPEQWEAKVQEANATNLKSWEESCARHAALREKYLAMAKQVNAWVPPSPDHVELQNFMRQQIEESIQWDCRDFPRPEPVSVEQYKVEELGYRERWVKQMKEGARQETENNANRTAWVNALRKSLEESA